ncbi:hypothetical protein A2870_00600 [Candidatus Curtissbacteria bacterium RIFCSPHIGHO2_01_FULL_41_11]|uniref:EfeO-type cupredoxin-like domain-containing protein n=1 Tax=Candidatus Curtissbacteria bacterium RIFCSPHIGHO2_01_FULL_41_11 TaxID=1797711 RepID=A0A1F5G3A6_9BACT|nr:MAG: hypothetical protein A2870_00600 [Candidatus Curtissbacteria bacterium RIFCSPHIGHO2_01_FULL_41_11]
MKINPIIYLVLTVAILAGLFFMFKPKKQIENTPGQAQTSTTIQSPSPESTVKTFELVIADKKLVSGPETIKITEGDEIVIRITTDEPEEFHVHGYDEFVDLEKDNPKELKFTANSTGRFIFELEESKIDLGAIEVSPK